MSCRAITALLFTLLLLPAHAQTRLPWLRAEGPRILNGKGETVTLRGINLGGWLVEEIWMMPFQPKPPQGSALLEIKDHVTLKKVLEKRYGPAGARRVFTALRSAWITEKDFDRIQALGFNCVRLPFLYDLLEEPDGLAWIDRCIDRAAKRGMYTILDLHGTPGRQSNEHHTGEIGPDALFKDDRHVRATEEVWKKLARRYKDRPEVAAYDTMNEPTGAKNTQQLYAVQDRLYRAIRSVDSRHIVMIEDGYKGLETMPAPKERGWKNVVLSTHYYHFEAKNEPDHRERWKTLAPQMAATLAKKGAPYYVGEMNLEPHGTAATMRSVLGTFNKQGWSWSPWTYKIMKNTGDRSMWGLYRNPNPITPLDPFRDTLTALLRKVEQVRSERLEAHKELAEAYREAAK